MTPSPVDPRAADDPLSDFRATSFADDEGTSKVVHVSGSGPAVVVMAEMPGISPDVARFARWVRDAGFTVHLPSLFGVDGAYPDTELGGQVMQRACVSAEFRAFGSGQASPVTAWLRALARHAHQECGGPGVGAIGMCFTGNFALSMMLEPSVLAPVLAQPSLPLDDAGGLESSPVELRTVRRRLEAEDRRVLAYRFEGDPFCTAARFQAYADALGDRFDGRTLDPAVAHPDPPPFFRDLVRAPHSVVTAHLVDVEGHPTIAARDEILRFFRDTLLPG